MKKALTVVLTGGGTIGHVSPVLAVVDELRQLAERHHVTLELIYVGRRMGVEQPMVERAGLRYVGISAGKLRRYVDLQNLVDPFRVMVGFFQALFLLIRFRPDVVFAKGGYVSLPVVLAASLLRIPIVAHETDSILGLANRWAARVATTLCVAFPVEQYRHQGFARPMVYTGNPVRAEFFGASHRIRSHAPYTLVIFGGSQGAQSINRALEALIERPIRDCSIIHLTGRAHFAEFAPRASTWYHPIDYTDHLADLLHRADLVVARSGGSIFELAAAGRPTILIPLSSSANQHQLRNAEFFVERQAAELLPEAELTPANLRARVAKLLGAPAERRQLAEHIHHLAVPDAAHRVARVIMDAVQSE